MFRAIGKEFRNLSAAIDPLWNWKSMRAVENPILNTTNHLPDVTRDFMLELGSVVKQGAVIFEGGALNDLARGQTPKDFDGHILSQDHPYIAMEKVERWARRSGFEVIPQKRNIRMLWKRVKILTAHGEYDLSCVYGIALNELAHNMADRADVSPCARSATAYAAFQSQRCYEGEEQGSLIFRSFENSRNRFRHLDRWLKYAINKYPDREVIYQDPKDAVLFEPLNAMRDEIAALHTELVSRGEKPQSFKPFRSLVPELYDHLAEKAGIRPM